MALGMGSEDNPLLSHSYYTYSSPLSHYTSNSDSNTSDITLTNYHRSFLQPNTTTITYHQRPDLSFSLCLFFCCFIELDSLSHKQQLATAISFLFLFPFLFRFLFLFLFLSQSLSFLFFQIPFQSHTRKNKIKRVNFYKSLFKKTTKHTKKTT